LQCPFKKNSRRKSHFKLVKLVFSFVLILCGVEMELCDSTYLEDTGEDEISWTLKDVGL